MADARDRLGAGAEQSGEEAKRGWGDWISDAAALMRWMAQSVYSFLGTAATVASRIVQGTVRLLRAAVRGLRDFTRKGQRRQIDRAQHVLDQRRRAAKRWTRRTLRAADRVVADAEARADDHVKAVRAAGALHVQEVESVHDGRVAKALKENGAGSSEFRAAQNNRRTEVTVARGMADLALREAKSAAAAYTANVRTEADNLKNEASSAYKSYAEATDANMQALEHLGERRRRPRIFREGLKSITQDQAGHRSAFTGAVGSGSERLQNAWSAVPKDTTKVDTPSPRGGHLDKPLMEYSSKNPSNRNWFSRARSATLGNRATRTLNRNQKRNKQKSGQTR
ncbi:hypothetical protein [Nocardiopsis coralliicola]